MASGWRGHRPLVSLFRVVFFAFSLLAFGIYPLGPTLFPLGSGILPLALLRWRLALQIGLSFFPFPFGISNLSLGPYAFPLGFF